MPPKRRSLPVVNNSSPQLNKRASDSPLPDLGKRQKLADDNNKEPKRDSYCWICHQPGHDAECQLEKCLRVYHTECLGKKAKLVGGICPECQLPPKTRSRFLTEDRLRDILEVAVKEFRDKHRSPDKMMFYRWPNIESPKVVKKMDLELLEDNIKDTLNPYKSFAEFISDVKWIHHNYCILDGVDSSTAKEAEGFVRAIQKEISDIEDCPMCFYYMLVKRGDKKFFIKICDPPHDIVWAKLKGSPHWPAKCLRVVNGKAHVRFFHTHDKSNIAINKKNCFAISESHPEYGSEQTVPRRKGYREAVRELEEYVDLYERSTGQRFLYAPKKTPYKYVSLKPGQRKRRQNRQSAPIDPNPEQDVLPESPPSASVSNDVEELSASVADESVPSPAPETNQSTEENIVTLDDQTEQYENEEETSHSVDHEDTVESEVETIADLPCASPVFSASMICEVDTSCSETQSSPVEDPSIPQCSFQQPTISTPLVTAISSLRNFEGQLSRPSNLLQEGSASVFQETLSGFSETGGIAAADNIRFNVGSPSVSSGIADDDDVIFLSSNSRPRNSNFNPTAVLPYIFSGSPDLQALFRDGRYVFDSLFIRCWASASRCPQAPEIISNMMTEIRRLGAEKKQLEEEKRLLEQGREEGKKQEEANVKLTEENGLLKAQLAEATDRTEELERKNWAAVCNARVLLDGLHNEYLKNLKVKDTETEQAMTHKEKELQERITNMYNDSVQQIAENTQLRNRIQKMDNRIAEKMTFKGLLGVVKNRLAKATDEAASGMRAQAASILGLAEPSGSALIRRSSADVSVSRRRRSFEAEATAAAHHYSRQVVSKQEHVQTIARKTSVSLQLERTSKLVTTTRNESSSFCTSSRAPPAIYGHPFDPRTSPVHVPPERFSPSSRQFKEPRSRQQPHRKDV